MVTDVNIHASTVTMTPANRTLACVHTAVKRDTQDICVPIIVLLDGSALTVRSLVVTVKTTHNAMLSMEPVYWAVWMAGPITTVSASH